MVIMKRMTTLSKFRVLTIIMMVTTLFGLDTTSAQTTYSSLERLTVTTYSRNIDDKGAHVLLSSSNKSSPYYSLSQGNLKSGNGLKSANEIIVLEGCTFSIDYFGPHTEAEKSAIRAALGNAVKDQTITNSGNPVTVSVSADFGLGSTYATGTADWILMDLSDGNGSVWRPSFLLEDIMGSNQNGSSYDISIQWNKTLTWDLSTGGGSSGSNPNLMYVLMHEMSHAMGVLSSASYNSSSGFYSLGWSGFPNIFDLGLRDGNGNVVWGNPNYQTSSQLEALFTSGNVWFESIVELYAPATWSNQSISHFDEGYNFSVDQLMTPFYNITTIYTSVGSLVNSVHAANGWGSSSSSTPVADFSANTTSGDAPLSVTFTDQSTNTPTSWSWTFGDGGTSTEQSPTYVYNTPGVYTVSLTATNSAGSDTETKTDYLTVTAVVVTPVAEFTANTTSGTAPLSVTFTDQSTNTPTSWAWDFGDGTGTSTNQSPSYTYTTPGVYTVILTATNSAGSDTETKTDYITVYDELIVDAGPDQSISAGASTTLEGSTTGGSGNFDITWTPQSLIVTQGILNPQTTSLQNDTTFYLKVVDLTTGMVKTDSVMVGILVGIDDIVIKEKRSIYPNPCRSVVHIELKRNDFRVEILDLSGQLIQAKDVSVYSDDKVLDWDVSILKPGTYFFRILNPKGVITGKIIKN